MRFIDFEGKTPVNTPADPDYSWTPWTQARWQAWLDKSDEYLREITRLHESGDKKARNEYIDAHSSHWGELKDWLRVLSKGKCWFFEVRDLASHWDVEHFRPKKEAKGFETKEEKAEVRDGYWWLAFEYSNYRLAGNVPNRKKGGFFPLHEKSLCSEYNNRCEESESPFLLDPTNQDDVLLLAFDEEGKAIPAPNSSPWELQRVEETARRLKLNEHTPLTEARRKVWQEVNRTLDEYVKWKSQSSSGVNPVAKEKMKAALEKLHDLTSDEAELSAVAKWCVYIREDAQLSRLVA